MTSVSDPSISAFLSEGTRTGILGYAGASGRPLVTPVWFIVEDGCIVFNTGNKYPDWKNNLFLAALVGQKLFRYEISGRKITHQEILWDQFGRTREVIMGPDGLLYIIVQNSTGANMSTAVSSPGMVVRLVPVSN